MKSRIPVLLLALLALALTESCSDENVLVSTPFSPEPARRARALILGDSYTVGQSIRPVLSWPQQLADSLAVAGDTLAVLDVVARTGWTSADLRDTVTSRTFDAAYDLVMLQIGVNDQFTGRACELFENDFCALLDTALTLAAGDTCGVLVLSIPDYGVTPFGRSFGADRICREIDRFNDAARAIAATRGVDFVDITDLSREAEHDPALVASDGLHYSGEMYRRWVARMLPAVRRALDSRRSSSP